MALPASLVLTPADSAHVVGEVYNLSLLATLVIGVAALALVALRRGSAGGRALACRAAVVALLALAVGHLLPVRPMLWVMPEGVATPLIALGKAQLGAGPLGGGRADAPAPAARGGQAATAPARPPAADRAASLATTLLLTYLAGIVLVALVTARARWRLGRLLATATRCDDDAWQAVLADAATAAGLTGPRLRQLQLHTTHRLDVPCTWSTRTGAVVVLPAAAATWRREHLRAALVHELSHVRHGDAQMALAARVACALFWFHPGAWWLAARLAAEGELACDDRVLLGGVRRSDYAELLAVAATRGAIPAPGVALAGRGGMRARLAAIVDTSRPLRAPSHAVIALVMAGSAAVAAPLGTVRMAPTRAVLATLMHDVAWESRAYAVVRLAQRADSVEVARTAARLDPSPQVRAWASYAVRRSSFLH